MSEKQHSIMSRWFDCACEASAETYHIEGHDDHEIDADTSAGGGKLPVLLHEIPVDGGKLLHRDETENHHGKHGGQDEGNLNRFNGGRSAEEEKRRERERCDGLGRTALQAVEVLSH